eukprot:INCI12313.1.p1 GENE.INCI12313.1~~INCI12313.1.p1  ORF type:complete len:236 (+),score=44.72 INCI12313.1:136-843(+)
MAKPSLVATVLLSAVAFGVNARSCTSPLQMDLLFGVEPYAEDTSYHNGMSLPEYICCNNEYYAEHSGFHEDVGFFDRLERAGAAEAGAAPTTFYDSTCGVPLFTAPIGRSFADWKAESIRHGWPSFRDAEINRDNIIIKTGGETVSSCGTHLGHNLPDQSGNRYCIDLVCMAGRDATGSSAIVVTDPPGSVGENASAAKPVYAIQYRSSSGAVAAPSFAAGLAAGLIVYAASTML